MRYRYKQSSQKMKCKNQKKNPFYYYISLANRQMLNKSILIFHPTHQASWPRTIKHMKTHAGKDKEKEEHLLKVAMQISTNTVEISIRVLQDLERHLKQIQVYHVWVYSQRYLSLTTEVLVHLCSLMLVFE